ncbi:MAG: glycosyltransferase [Candidatus Komeilibacteria bacterium]
MKICLVNSLYDPDNRGGAETVVKMLAQDLIARDHQVTIITTQSSSLGQKILLEKIGKIDVYRLGAGNLCNFNKLSQFGPILRLFWHFIDQVNLVNYCRIKKLLQKLQPDLIWVHNLKGLGYLSTKAYHDDQAKYWQTIHDVQYYDPSGTIIYHQIRNIFYRFFRWCYWQLNRLLIKKPDLLISPSQWLADFYQQKKLWLGVERVVKRNPLVTNQTNEIHQQQGDLIQLLYLGQIEEHKGIRFLINTLQQVEFDFHLTVIGSGSILTELQSQVDQKISFVGQVANQDLGQYFLASDLLIMPTLCYENSPTVISEAQAMNCLVLASAIGGIKEMIREGDNGWLFEPGNEKDFLAKLVMIKNTDLISLRPKMTKQNLSVQYYLDSLLARL